MAAASSTDHATTPTSRRSSTPRQLQALHRRAGTQLPFITWLSELRHSNRRKRNLIAALDRLGL